MDWSDIRYFVAIAREGQMLSAAKRLGVSQSLLSRHLSALERALATTLVHRTTRGCLLTEEGAKFLVHAERIEAEMQAAQATLGNTASQIAGTVRLGTPDGLGAGFIAHNLASLLHTQPALKVQLVPVPINFSLSQREADLAIVIGQPERGRLITKKLTDYTLGLYASKAYLAEHGKPQSRADLEDHRLIGYVDDLLPTASLNYTAELGAGWNTSIEVSTAIGQLAAVKGGAGIGVLHDFMARGEPDLEPILQTVIIRRDYWLVWHENMQSVRRIHFLVDQLTELVKRHAGQFVREI